MTREEIFRNGTKEEISEILCDMIQEYAWLTEEVADPLTVFPHECRACPARKHCKPGHQGFIEWIEEEQEE